MESQFGACAVRISRLVANGTPDYGNSTGALCIAGGVNKFKHDFEVEKGKEIFETDACGTPFVIFKLDDITKWATFELTLGRFDDRLPEILGLGQRLGPAAAPYGHTIDAGAGCAPGAQKPVCIELWRQRRLCGTQLNPGYKRVVLPFCKLTPQGFDSDDSVALPVYAGQSFANANFLDGPNNDLDELVGQQNFVYAEVLDDDFCVEPSPYNYTALPANLST